MSKTKSSGRHPGLQRDALKLRKLVVNLGNVFVRLAAANRRKVLRLLERLLFGKSDTPSYWDRWSKDDMRACCLQIEPISQKMTNGLRRWASELSKTVDNDSLAIRCLVDELVCRTWIEES